MKDKLKYLDELKNNPQKFKPGDLVLAKSTDWLNRPVQSRAIVIGSYADQFGAKDDIRNHRTYTLFPNPKYCVKASWYDESELTLIAENKFHLISEWKDAQEKQIALINRSLYQWFDDHKELTIKRVDGIVIISIVATNCTVSDSFSLEKALHEARKIIGE